ncbi:MAG: Holliday junction branch migration protein RuvA [Actinomycetaceae bacterium]|nr:Holliday junction branch migration protein RuvA [Arcanobacterium sp.]MDD7686409.1 Holliday junction branch migration protein RuvA [Actinomycetaceae bacterium]MDY5272689.1 Holliday junction branch migration protein RuvA [Arcanobacterium sp.]
MIASVSGTVDAVTTSSAVINVSGVGFEIYATPDTLSQIHVGETAALYTTLVVKEDSLTLFGFATLDEKDVFSTLLSVSGIGARTALAILSVLPPDELRAAIAAKNEAALTRVPGIGKKGAQRMILEIGTKLGPARAGLEATAGSASAVPTNPDVLEALVNLGWPERLAQSAIDEAYELAGGQHLDIPELLRNSLRILGAKR